MHRILYAFLIVIMSYFIMYFVSDDKNKGDQSINTHWHMCKFKVTKKKYVQLIIAHEWQK